MNSTEVYGFVLWITTFVIYALFILWAYLPDHALHSLGVTYYPDKMWALAAAAWILVTAIFIVVGYVAYCMYSTNSLDSLATIKDKYSRPLEKADTLSRDEEWHAIPAIGDIPIATVNQLLYSPT